MWLCAALIGLYSSKVCECVYYVTEVLSYEMHDDFLRYNKCCIINVFIIMQRLFRWVMWLYCGFVPFNPLLCNCDHFATPFIGDGAVVHEDKPSTWTISPPSIGIRGHGQFLVFVRKPVHPAREHPISTELESKCLRWLIYPVIALYFMSELFVNCVINQLDYMIQYVKTKKGKCEVFCDTDDEPPITTVSACCPYLSLDLNALWIVIFPILSFSLKT